MTSSIAFPHLGIELPHVGQSIDLFGLSIAYYGIIIAAAMFAGITLAMHLAKRSRQNPDDYMDFALLLIVTALLGARIYYVAFSWSYYRAHPLEILHFRGGGLAIYGGVIAGVATAVCYTRRKNLPLRIFLDTAMPGLTLGQVIGRWGNFFNREAFGGYTDSLLAMRLPLDAVSESDVTAQMMEHAVQIDGIRYIQVHPTFLYESLWNTALLILLLIVYRRKHRDGEIFLLYLLGYGSGRLWIEGLRTDQLLLPGTGIAVSQVLSGVLAAVAAVLLIRLKRNKRK